MKIACICCTYKRPRELAAAVESFVRQDYPAELRELIVLDDAGQYDPRALDGIPGVRLVVSPVRFRTIGEKRNATAALVSPDVEAYCVWDDDDIYLPWHLTASAAALASADYTVPTKVWIDKRKRLAVRRNSYLFHGAWAFRRSAFEKVHGYPFMQSGQDQALLSRLKGAKLRRGDPIRHDARPSYIYRWGTTPCRWHLSGKKTQAAYDQLAERGGGEHVEQVVPAWDRDWLRLAGVRPPDAEEEGEELGQEVELPPAPDVLRLLDAETFDDEEPGNEASEILPPDPEEPSMPALPEPTLPDLRETFARVVVINLARRPERLRALRQGLPDPWPFKPFERFPAIDAQLCPPPAWWKGKPGAWGCYRSHLCVWEETLNAGLPSVLVLEDDAVFCPGFAERAAAFLAAVPADWNLLVLGARHVKTPRPVAAGVERPVQIYGTHAYALRGDALRLAYLHASGVGPEIDNRLSQFLAKPGVIAYSAAPWLVGQADGFSDITGGNRQLAATRKFG